MIPLIPTGVENLHGDSKALKESSRLQYIEPVDGT